jgi:hypothetical protein
METVIDDPAFLGATYVVIDFESQMFPTASRAASSSPQVTARSVGSPFGLSSRWAMALLV